MEKKSTLAWYKDNAVCANGAMYRKDVRGFLPELMDKMYGDRVVFKKKMIQAKKAYEKTPTKKLEKEIARCNNIQMAKKISLLTLLMVLSVTSILGTTNLPMQKQITLSGQVSIRWIENKMNSYLNKILKTEVKTMLLPMILILSTLILALGEIIYKGREKTNESIVSFLNKICEVEFEKYIESSYEALKIVRKCL